MMDIKEPMEARKMVKRANGLLLITLLAYMGTSFGIGLLSFLFGRQLPFLNNTVFQLLAGQAALLIPSFVYLKWNRLKIREFLHIKMLHPVTLLLLPVFTGASYPIISLCNYLSLQVSENVIGDTMGDLLAGLPLWGCVLVIAFVPCVIEELIFRGTLYYSYKRSGLLKAGICSAILFGFFHMNLNQMSYAIVMGLLFVALNEATGSILSSMIVHFLINGTSMITSWIYYKQNGNLDTAAAQSDMSATVVILVLAIMSLFSLVILALVLWAMASLEKRTERIKEMFTNKDNEKCKIISPTLVLALLICGVMMIMTQIAMMQG